MKNYTVYMDNISDGRALYNKVMKHVVKKPDPLNRNRSGIRSAGMVARVAALLICVCTVLGMDNISTTGTPFNHGVSSSDNQLGNEQAGAVMLRLSDSETIIPGLPGEEWPLFALTLNKADSQMPDTAYIPGFLYFWYELTDAQAKAVLPEFSFAEASTAYYHSDGSLWNVTAYEKSSDGRIAVYDDHYVLTEIKIAPGAIMEDVIYNYEAKTSDVYGVQVTAGVCDYDWLPDTALYIASFKLDDISYSIKLHDSSMGDSGLNRLTEITNEIIRNGKPDLSVFNDPGIPELRYDQLTLKEAQSDPDFGAYVPEGIPAKFVFESSQRFINQSTNTLSVNWSAAYDSVYWNISKPTEYDREHIVSAGDREKYDLSLYPIPRGDSIPSELWEIVNNPVFLAEELTLDIIQARSYQVDDRGDTPGWRMSFSVLYYNALVNVNTKGVSPVQMLEMLEALKNWEALK